MSTFGQSMPLETLYQCTLAKQGIIALCFTDGSAPCYDVSHHFHRARLMSTLSYADNYDYLVGWKVFACSSNTEAFFRAFFYLDGFKVDTTALPPQNTPVAAKDDIRLPANHGDLDQEVFHQNASLGAGTESAQRHSLSSEERRQKKKQKQGECNYAML